MEAHGSNGESAYHEDHGSTDETSAGNVESASHPGSALSINSGNATDKRPRMVPSILRRLIEAKFNRKNLQADEWNVLFLHDKTLKKIYRQYKEKFRHKAMDEMNAISLFREEFKDPAFIINWIIVRAYDEISKQINWNVNGIIDSITALFKDEKLDLGNNISIDNTFVPVSVDKESRNRYISAFTKYIQQHEPKSTEAIHIMVDEVSRQMIEANTTNDTHYLTFKKKNTCENVLVKAIVNRAETYQQFYDDCEHIFNNLIEMRLLNNMGTEPLLRAINALDIKIETMHVNGNPCWLIIFRNYWSRGNEEWTFEQLRGEEYADDLGYLGDFLWNMFRDIFRELKWNGTGVIDATYKYLVSYVNAMESDSGTVETLVNIFINDVKGVDLDDYVAGILGEIYRLKRTFNYHKMCFNAYNGDVYNSNANEFTANLMTLVCSRYSENKETAIEKFTNCFADDWSIAIHVQLLIDLYATDYIAIDGVFTGFLPDTMVNALATVCIPDTDVAYRRLILRYTIDVLDNLEYTVVLKYDGLRQRADKDDMRFVLRFQNHFQDEYMAVFTTTPNKSTYTRRRDVPKKRYGKIDQTRHDDWVLSADRFPYRPLRSKLQRYMDDYINGIGLVAHIQDYFPCLADLEDANGADQLVRWNIAYFELMYGDVKITKERVNYFVETVLYPLVRALIRAVFEYQLKKGEFFSKEVPYESKLIPNSPKYLSREGLIEFDEQPLDITHDSSSYTLTIPSDAAVQQLTSKFKISFQTQIQNKIPIPTQDSDEIEVVIDTVITRQVNTRQVWHGVKTTVPTEQLVPSELEKRRVYLMTHASPYLNISEFSVNELKKCIVNHLIYVFGALKPKPKPAGTAGVLRQGYNVNDETERWFTRPPTKGDGEFDDLVQSTLLDEQTVQQVAPLRQAVLSIQNTVTLSDDLCKAFLMLNLEDKILMQLIVECLFGDPYYYDVKDNNGETARGPAMSPWIRDFLGTNHPHTTGSRYTPGDRQFRILVLGCYWRLESHRILFFVDNLPEINYGEWETALANFKDTPSKWKPIQRHIKTRVIHDDAFVGQLNFQSPESLLISWISAIARRMLVLLWATRNHEEIAFSVYLKAVDNGVDKAYLEGLDSLYKESNRDYMLCINTYMYWYYKAPVTFDATPIPFMDPYPPDWNDNLKRWSDEAVVALNAVRIRRTAATPQDKPLLVESLQDPVTTPVEPEPVDVTPPVQDAGIPAHGTASSVSTPAKPAHKRSDGNAAPSVSTPAKPSQTTVSQVEEDDTPTLPLIQEILDILKKKNGMEVEPKPAAWQPPAPKMEDTWELKELREAINFYATNKSVGKDQDTEHELKRLAERAEMRGELKHVFVSLIEHYIRSRNPSIQVTHEEIRRYFMNEAQHHKDMLEDNIYSGTWKVAESSSSTKSDQGTTLAFVKALFDIAEAHYMDMKAFKAKVTTDDYRDYQAFKDSKGNTVNLQLDAFKKVLATATEEVKTTKADIIAANAKSLKEIEDERKKQITEQHTANKNTLDGIMQKTKETNDKLALAIDGVTNSQTSFKKDVESFLKAVGSFKANSEKVHNHLLQTIEHMLSRVTGTQGRRLMLTGHIKPLKPKDGKHVLPGFVTGTETQHLCGSCGDLTEEVKKKIDKNEPFTLVVCEQHAKQLRDNGIEPIVLLKEKNDAFYYYLF
jgi:hypothetical protein